MSRVLNNPASPGSDEHLRIVTASKVSTILGLNPWQTPGELWMEMTGRAPREVLEGDRLAWGHIAEDSLVKWWLHENPGWQAGPGEVAYTNDDLPFANQATLDRRARRGRRFHVLECKTSDSSRTWDTGGQLPSHVYAQVIAQMGISGIHEASVVCQLGSTVPVVYDVPWDADLWAEVVGAIEEFVGLLNEDEYPLDTRDWQPAVDAAQRGPWDEDDTEWGADQVSALAGMLAERDQLDARIAEEKDRLSHLAGGSRVFVDGKVFMSLQSPRFSKTNVPDNARHLLKDPDVMSLKLDSKKLREKYPEVYNAALGDSTYTFRKDALK